MRQCAYYRYKTDISIYHFRASLLSVQDLRVLLEKGEHGYIDVLIGPDLLSSHHVPAGDEVPPGSLEACYLPGAFHRGGSALGIRMNNGTTEWLCFSKDIQHSVLETLDVDAVPRRKLLFDHVASVAKPPNMRRSRWVPYTEHRDWFESLRTAGLKACRVSLTWRNFGTELREEHARMRVMEGDLMASRLRDFEDMHGEYQEDDMRFENGEAWDQENEQEDDDDEDIDDHDEEHEEDGNDMTPMTIGRHTSVIYTDLSLSPGAATPHDLESTSSHTSSSSIPSDRSTNALLTQRHPSSSYKGKGKAPLISASYT